MRGYWEIRWPHCDYLRAPVPPQNSQKYIFVTKQVVILFHCCTNVSSVMKSSFPETLFLSQNRLLFCFIVVQMSPL